MASISGRGAKGHHTYTLTLTEKSTSVEKNESYVDYSFDLIDDANWFWEGWHDNIAYSVSANGSVIASGSIPNHLTKNQNIANGSFTVPHNADGTKSISYSFSVTDGANQYYTSGNASASGTMALTTIPRASTISAVSGTTIGGQMTVTIARAVSTFTHQLWYKVGNSDWYDLGSGIGTSKTFTIDIATANQFPNAMNGTLQLCVRTFNGTTMIGSDYYKDVTVSVPDYTPTISSIKLTGNSLLSGEYVQGKSTVTAEIAASSMYGATIKSYSSVVDGKTYAGSKITSSVLSNGSKSVAVTVTDTRGKTAKLASSAFTVREYANPVITEFTLVRQADGATVIATVKGIVSSVNSKNDKTIQVTLNGVTQNITSSSYSINGTTTFTNVPTDNTLTATAKITDSFTSATREFVLPTVAVTMDFHHSGKGIAMGKVAEKENLFDVAWDMQVKGNINGVSIGTDSYVLGGSRDDITDENWIAKAPSFIGTYSQNNKWYSTLSLRHRNGLEDGTNYGLQLRSILTQEDNLSWRQNINGSWQGWKTLLDSNNTADRVIEQGTSGIWTYRKWNSGIAECWGIHTMTSSCTAAWGALYYSDKLSPRINYPFTFTSRPQESVFCRGDSISSWAYPEGGGVGMNTTTQTGSYGFLRPTTMTEAQVRYEFTVVGRWK